MLQLCRQRDATRRISSGSFVRVRSGAGTARRAGRSGGRDRRAEGGLHFACRHPGLLRDRQPIMVGSRAVRGSSDSAVSARRHFPATRSPCAGLIRASPSFSCADLGYFPTPLPHGSRRSSGGAGQAVKRSSARAEDARGEGSGDIAQLISGGLSNGNHYPCDRRALQSDKMPRQASGGPTHGIFWTIYRFQPQRVYLFLARP